MAAKWTNFYKIVQANNIDNTSAVTNNQEIGSPNSYGNYNWYHRVITGSGSRLSRYREWENMDSDVDISRALDIIAEEISGNCTKHDEPLTLNVIDLDYMSSSEVNTVKTALRHWCEIHKWKTKIFNIARHTIKYGDVYFKKTTPTSTWVYIHPKDVKAAIVNSDDISEVQAWQVQQKLYSDKQSNSMTGMHETDIIPANDLVRFTLNNDMSDEAPFGESVLKSIYKSFKQKELLEDAVIIYRIQRAPERRVFYIDVGKMPPNRVKQYLEGIKNEIRQKKIPTHNGTNSEIDSVYNPQSQSEDYFLAQKCISFNTLIPLLDGEVKTLSDIISDYEQGVKNWVYSIDKKTGKFIPGEISWAGPTRENAQMVRVHFDNNEYLDCTPDHRLVNRLGQEIEAQNLNVDESMMSLYLKNAKTNKDQKKSKYKVTKIEYLNHTEDTGCLTIEDPGNNHNFAINSGVYICNSDGRGSKIETLPGGQSVGEISDVEYFNDKMFRGLRIPLSYMKEGDAGGAVFNDGKVGQSYISELRFSLYIERFQTLLEEVFDAEFKSYLRYIGLRIDNTKFAIELPEPSNFGKYREQEMYAALLSSYSSADGIEYLSKKFVMKKYLQLSNDEIIENERMKLEEMGKNPDTPDKNDLISVYSPESIENDMSEMEPEDGMIPDEPTSDK